VAKGESCVTGESAGPPVVIRQVSTASLGGVAAIDRYLRIPPAAVAEISAAQDLGGRAGIRSIIHEAAVRHSLILARLLSKRPLPRVLLHSEFDRPHFRSGTFLGNFLPCSHAFRNVYAAET
jgi:hypothetical protein